MTDTPTASLTLSGRDNSGRFRQTFAERVARWDDDEFVRGASDVIWLSAFANNNPRSDYHWQADACSDEAKRRGRPELYREAHDKARRMM